MGIPKDLLKQNPCLSEWNILSGYRGSIAHGMWTNPKTEANSIDDKDIMTICVPPIDYYYGIKEFGSRGTKEIKRDEWDIVTYEARKFISLLAVGNPNVLSLLWLDNKHYIDVTEAGQLIIDNRQIFVGRHVYRSFTGYAYAQLHKMTHIACEGYLGQKRKGLIEKYGFDCYDAKTTEFLTDKGWRFFEEISKNDCVATIKTQTGEMEFQHPISCIDKLYTGKMYIIEPSSSKAIVTPNHNLLVSATHRSKKNNFSIKYDPVIAKWELKSMNNIIDGYHSIFHIRRAPSYRIDEYPVSDDYLTLAGFYVSEGCSNFRKNKKGVKFIGIRFTQKKKGDFHTIADNLCLKFPIRKYDYGKESIWTLKGEIAQRIYHDFGHAETKHLPDWCFHLSARQMDVLWRALMLGDGCYKKSGETYYTRLSKLAGDIQAAMILSGYPCTMYGPYKSNTTYGPNSMYHIVRSNISDAFHALNTCKILKIGEFPKSKKDGYPIKEIEVENTRVVCFEVPNGTLITRNNGKVAIHGNCKNAAHLIRLLRMGIEFMKDGELIVERPDAQQLLEIKRGEWTLDQVKAESDRLFKVAEEAYLSSTLPKAPDMEAVNRLCVDVVKAAQP